MNDYIIRITYIDACENKQETEHEARSLAEAQRVMNTLVADPDVKRVRIFGLMEDSGA